MHSDPHDPTHRLPNEISPAMAQALIESTVRSGKATITAFVDQLWQVTRNIEFLSQQLPAVAPAEAAAAAAELDDALFDEVGGLQNYLREFIEATVPAPTPPPRIPRTPIRLPEDA